MSDLIAESQELLRKEKMEAAARRWVPVALATCAALVVMVASWQLLGAWRTAAQQDNTARYILAMEAGSLDMAASDLPADMAALARITAGAPVGDRAPRDWAELERLAASDLTAPEAEAIAARRASPWRARAYLRAAALRAEAGESDKARAYLAEIAADPTAPPSLKARAAALDGLCAVEGKAPYVAPIAPEAAPVPAPPEKPQTSSTSAAPSVPPPPAKPAV